MNTNQKAAIYYVNGPLLILGGAGSGKTSLLAGKITWLIREYDVAPARIVALTSSARAARALHLTIADQIDGNRLDGLTISTVPALGLGMLREHRTELGLRAGFSIYGPTESRALLDLLLRRRRAIDPKVTTEAVRHWIADRKQALVDPNATDDNPVAIAATAVYADYEARLMACNAVDLDDLIAKPSHLLATRSDVLTRWHERVSYLLVDDYETLSPEQHRLARLLTQDGGMLTAAGDDNSPFVPPDRVHTGLVQLRKEVPNLRTLRLERNYRSTGHILNTVNLLAAHPRSPPDRMLRGERELGAPIAILTGRNEIHEAERVVAALLEHKSRSHAEFSEYAIFLADAADPLLFEQALRAERVPCFRAGAASAFFDRTEIRDVLYYLRLIGNPADDVAFRRALGTPRRNINGATVVALERDAERTGVNLLATALDPGFAPPPGAGADALRALARWLQQTSEQAMRADPVQLVRDLLADLRYDDWLRDTCNDVQIAERRIENVTQLIVRMQRLARLRKDATFVGLMDELNTAAALDQGDQPGPGDAVVLLPLAAAKGLDCRHVFIAGLDEERTPNATDGDSRGTEDRRSLLTGMTCARDTLTFSCAERRTHGGQTRLRQPSRFLTELPQGNLVWSDREPPRLLFPVAKSTETMPARPELGAPGT